MAQVAGQHRAPDFDSLPLYEQTLANTTLHDETLEGLRISAVQNGHEEAANATLRHQLERDDVSPQEAAYRAATHKIEMWGSQRAQELDKIKEQTQKNRQVEDARNTVADIHESGKADNIPQHNNAGGNEYFGQAAKTNEAIGTIHSLLVQNNGTLSPKLLEKWLQESGAYSEEDISLAMATLLHDKIINFSDERDDDGTALSVHLNQEWHPNKAHQPDKGPQPGAAGEQQYKTAAEAVQGVLAEAGALTPDELGKRVMGMGFGAQESSDVINRFIGTNMLNKEAHDDPSNPYGFVLSLNPEAAGDQQSLHVREVIRSVLADLADPDTKAVDAKIFRNALIKMDLTRTIKTKIN